MSIDNAHMNHDNIQMRWIKEHLTDLNDFFASLTTGELSNETASEKIFEYYSNIIKL